MNDEQPDFDRVTKPMTQIGKETGWPETTDAVAWAEEFRAVSMAADVEQFDAGWIISWFANAIEQGRSAGLRRETDEWEIEDRIRKSRAGALLAARDAVIGKGLAGTPGPEPQALIALAQWIMDGTDPWAGFGILTLPEGMSYTPHVGDESVSRLSRSHSQRGIQDTPLPESDPEGRDGPNYDQAEGDEGLGR